MENYISNRNDESNYNIQVLPLDDRLILIMLLTSLLTGIILFQCGHAKAEVSSYRECGRLDELLEHCIAYGKTFVFFHFISFI